ncbi:hypothetical protein EHQ16_07905 [Leptospira kanakyensis]|uniref:Uncharacterized protein n=1 Tax=Leptospira kanakyensis TaxID=2484968 RepID=A0A6N4QGR2_9LEPT|nr:hypothetical protein [Leptospira kanakyensis]TGK48792.1 hypothetical protein EHQ11_15705 [Leptospira kanakyensis]TGK61216.1 hypothetical protein EHQ16_07905 [Leptospira kanakyensis]TGK71063.1 hypothetical protein EHQ18_08340 [Leptospira kanakyensis]
MRFISIVVIPITIIISIYFFIDESANNEIFNSFTGLISGSLLSFYVTSTYEALKYRISEKNIRLKYISKTDLILNNNLKNLIHNFKALNHFEENLDKPLLQELKIYTFTTNTDEFLSINDSEVIIKISNCLLHFEHIATNLENLKNFHSKFNIDFEKALRERKSDLIQFQIQEFINKSARLRIIIRSSISEAREVAIDTISFLQANAKRIKLSKFEKFFFGNITMIYTNNLDKDYLEERVNVLNNTFKLI